MSTGPTLGIDLDGTIAQYSGWIDEETIGDPIPGARAFLEALKAKGYSLQVFSARAGTPKGRQAIIHWLVRHQLVHLFDGVTSEKLYKFAAFVDDRAVHFDGKNYDTILAVM